MANETASTHTNSAAEAEETKKALSSLLEKLKKLFEWFSDLRKSNSIIQQMQQLQQDLEIAVANGEMTKDSIESLYELVSDMEGRLDTINPENAEEMMAALETEAENFIKNTDGQKITSSEQSKTGLISEVKQALEGNGVVCGSDFESKFYANAKVIAGDGMDKNHLLIEIDGQILEAAAALVEAGNNLKVTVYKNDRQYEDVFDENGALKKGFSYIPKTDGNPIHDLTSVFCKNNNLTYVFDKEKERERLEKEFLSQASPKALFIKSRSDKTTLTENGRIQSHYDKSDGTFRVRDSKTGDMLRVRTGEGEIKVYMYHNTKDFNVVGKELKLAEFKQQGDRKVQVKASLYEGSADISALFRCDEMRKYLELNGVTLEMQQKAYHHETDERWSKVNTTNMAKVEGLKAACEAVCREALGDENYEIQTYNSKKATFLNISQGKHCISFSFNKDGDPLTINYRSEKGERSKFVYNINTKGVSPEYNALRSDPAFGKLFKTACSALKEVGIDTNLTKQKPLEIENVLMPTENSKRFDIPTKDRNLNNGAEYSGYQVILDKTTAEKVNRAALLAIENQSISIARIKIDLNCSSSQEAKEIMRKLMQLGVVQEQGMATKNAKMSLSEYTDLIVKLASDYSARERFNDDGRHESYAAFLVDAYANTYSKEREAMLDVMQPEIVSALQEAQEAIDKDKATLSVTEIQRSVRSYSKALRTAEILEGLGVLSKNQSREHSYDFLCGKEKIQELLDQFGNNKGIEIPAENTNEPKLRKAQERDERLC